MVETTSNIKMKGIMLTATSFALTAAVLGNAYVQKKQFYPSVVYITKSHPSLAVSILPLFIVWSSAFKFVYGADADDVHTCRGMRQRKET